MNQVKAHLAGRRLLEIVKQIRDKGAIGGRLGARVALRQDDSLRVHPVGGELLAKLGLHGGDFLAIVRDSEVNAAALRSTQRYHNLSYGLPVRTAEKVDCRGAALRLR